MGCESKRSSKNGDIQNNTKTGSAVNVLWMLGNVKIYWIWLIFTHLSIRTCFSEVSTLALEHNLFAVVDHISSLVRVLVRISWPAYILCFIGDSPSSDPTLNVQDAKSSSDRWHSLLPERSMWCSLPWPYTSKDSYISVDMQVSPCHNQI